MINKKVIIILSIMSIISLTGCQNKLQTNSDTNNETKIEENINISESGDTESNNDEIDILDNTYIFAESNTEKFNYSTDFKVHDLFEFKYSIKDLEIAKNEIFARYGHDFDDQEFQNYFESQEWYEKVNGKKVSYDDLNEIEKYNVDILNKYINITKEMEEGNGSAIHYEDGIVYVYFKDGMYPIGKEVSLKYELDNKIANIESHTLVKNEDKIKESVFHINTSLKNILDKDIKLLFYIDGSLYNEKTVYIDKMFLNFDFYNDLLIKSDKSFEVKGWYETYTPVDRDGNKLKLFDYMDDRDPYLNTSFFGEKFIAEDGYIYSFDRIFNANGLNVYCDKISDKKVISYSLTINDVTIESESDSPLYDVTINYQYEDGTSSTENFDFRYYNI